MQTLRDLGIKISCLAFWLGNYNHTGQWNVCVPEIHSVVAYIAVWHVTLL